MVSKLQQLGGMPAIHDYRRFIRSVSTETVDGIESFPCVIPNWDNTPRSGANGVIMRGSTPALFRQHVRRALEQTPTVRRMDTGLCS